MGLREAIGRALGAILSPIILQGSLLRRGRVFHPEGVVYRAEVRALAAEGGAGTLAQRLEGPALVRLSGGLWRWRSGKGQRRPDLLGISVRFRDSEEVTPEASVGDQDLLFLSARRFALIPIALLTTNVRDFLANTYYAQLPFKVAGVGRLEFRLVPQRAAKAPGDRRDKLERAAAAGLATLRLEARPARLGFGKRWVPVAQISLIEPVDIDQAQLLFTPFHTGRGIVPTGLLQAVRRLTYPASYLGRRLARRRRQERRSKPSAR